MESRSDNLVNLFSVKYTVDRVHKREWIDNKYFTNSLLHWEKFASFVQCEKKKRRKYSPPGIDAIVRGGEKNWFSVTEYLCINLPFYIYLLSVSEPKFEHNIELKISPATRGLFPNFSFAGHKRNRPSSPLPLVHVYLRRVESRKRGREKSIRPASIRSSSMDSSIPDNHFHGSNHAETNLLPHLARSPRSVDSKFFSFFFFLYTIGTPANWVVTSPTGGFSRQISENPRRDRWPSLEHSRTSEVAERKREEGRRDTRRASHRRDEDGERWDITGRERDKWAEVWGKHIPYRYSLSCSSYPLAISCRISPSRLIELLVYTYTTHNDSSERERGTGSVNSSLLLFLRLSRVIFQFLFLRFPTLSSSIFLPSSFFFYLFHWYILFQLSLLFKIFYIRRREKRANSTDLNVTILSDNRNVG